MKSFFSGATSNGFLFTSLFFQTVREKIGAIATPDYIQNAPSLPKTRSGINIGLFIIKALMFMMLKCSSVFFFFFLGKIMRRVLRKIACNERDLGDVCTLADSSVIEQLFENRCCTAMWPAGASNTTPLSGPHTSFSSGGKRMSLSYNGV